MSLQDHNAIKTSSTNSKAVSHRFIKHCRIPMNINSSNYINHWQYIFSEYGRMPHATPRLDEVEIHYRSVYIQNKKSCIFGTTKTNLMNNRSYTKTWLHFTLFFDTDICIKLTITIFIELMFRT